MERIESKMKCDGTMISNGTVRAECFVFREHYQMDLYKPHHKR